MEILIIALVMILDQISKHWIEIHTELHGHVEIIKDFFYITYTKNTGAAWSILTGQVSLLAVISVIEIIIIAVFLCRMHKEKHFWYRLSLSLMLGGALGNLIDRVMLGYVRDFLHFYPFGYSFPVFNIADCGITVGMGIVIVLMFLEEKNEGVKS